MQSNDYLRLARHPEILQAELDVFDELLSEDYSQEKWEGHRRDLEQNFSEYVGLAGSMLCSSGYSANSGLIPALVEPGTPVFIDMLAHASLWMGIAGSEAVPTPFIHNNLHSLKRAIKKAGKPGIIIVDTVYSTIGSLAPLADIVDICKETGCILIADESHGLGIFGEDGRGLVHELGLTDDVHFITVSLAKTFARRGGLIAYSTQELGEYLRNNHIPYQLNTPMEPNYIARFEKTLEIMKSSDERRKNLMANAEYFRQGLTEIGFNLQNSNSQIVSIEVGTDPEVIKVQRELENRGVFASIFCPPATADGRSLMRFSVHCDLTTEQLDHVIEACREIYQALNAQNWASTRRSGRGANRRSGGKEDKK